MFYSDSHSMFRIAVVGVLAYLTMVVLLRASGKRTLSKMNAFDMIVTVALGSSLASALLDKNVALADGALAFSLLIGLQFAITWLSVRSRTVSRLVKAEPTLLFYQGRFLSKAMREERVVEDEVLAALRDKGVGELSEVQAIVLESQGELTVVRNGTTGDSSTLRNVRRRESH